MDKTQYQYNLVSCILLKGGKDITGVSSFEGVHSMLAVLKEVYGHG